MEVYLIRHTTPQIEKGICYGQSDIPLADTFNTESKELLDYLSISFDAVFSSPLGRCTQLARLINCEQEIIYDDRLKDMNFGNWEMTKWNEINQHILDEW